LKQEEAVKVHKECNGGIIFAGSSQISVEATEVLWIETPASYSDPSSFLTGTFLNA